MEIRLDKEAFKYWLTQRGSGNVGRTNDPHGCAFANYLMETQRVLRASVGAAYIEVLHRGPSGIEEKRLTPRWLSHFISQFDSKGRAKGVRDGNFALECLFRAEQALEMRVFEPTEAALKKAESAMGFWPKIHFGDYHKKYALITF